MNLADFFPNYPDVENPTLQQKILNKKEFFDIRLRQRLESIEKGELLNHQKIIQRFMSSHTLFDELLLIHQTGTGKTGAAFGVTENLYDSKSFARVIVLARGGDLLITLMKQLVFLYSKRYKLPDEIEPENVVRTIRRIVSDFYQFQTFETFTKSLSGFSDEIIQSKFENSIFILDEVHNIKPDKQSTVYKQFHRLFHLLKNRRVLLMSATPMRDDVRELAYIMNLILPLDRQLPDENFSDIYVNDGEIVRQETLKETLQGRISFLNTSSSDVRESFQGDFINDLEIEQFKLYPTQMEDIQFQAYARAFKQDTSIERSIYSNTQQASLFVFPNGTYGPEGVAYYESRMKELRTQIADLNSLRKLSSKYAFIVQNILDNPKKLIYIYCSFINGSGINMISLILQQYGFHEAKGTETRSGKRYIALTSDTANIDTLLSFFNSRRNKFGEYCQVIIGSRKISEGFTFKNIQIIHVTTMHWNYTVIQQAIARAIRFRSHQDLIFEGYNPVVQIYQHASLVPQDQELDSDFAVRSLDVMMMETAQEKDILIRKMLRVVKEVAFDCPLTYERNIRYNADGSRECDYQECEYKCDSALEPTEVDLSTYNLYYHNSADTINRIRKLFSQYYSLSFESIQDTTECDTFQLLQALSDMIRYNMPIVDRHGVECYLRECRNEYYLVDNIVLPNNRPELHQYAKTPFILRNQSLQATIGKKVEQLHLDIIRGLKVANSEDDLKKRLEQLPLVLQELVLENAILSEPNKLSEWVKSIYKPFIKETSKFKYVSILLLPRARCFTQRMGWSDCLYEEQLEERKETINPEENNPYGVYGIQQGDNFCIKEIVARRPGEKVDKRKEKSGSNCLEVGWNKPKLAELCIRLAIPVPDNALNPKPIEELSKTKSGQKVLAEWQEKGWTIPEIARGLYWYQRSKDDICKTLKEWFNARNLLIAGNCGKSGKKKD